MEGNEKGWKRDLESDPQSRVREKILEIDALWTALRGDIDRSERALADVTLSIASCLKRESHLTTENSDDTTVRAELQEVRKELAVLRDQRQDEMFKIVSRLAARREDMSKVSKTLREILQLV